MPSQVRKCIEKVFAFQTRVYGKVSEIVSTPSDVMEVKETKK